MLSAERHSQPQPAAASSSQQQSYHCNRHHSCRFPRPCRPRVVPAIWVVTAGPGSRSQPKYSRLSLEAIPPSGFRGSPSLLNQSVSCRPQMQRLRQLQPPLALLPQPILMRSFPQVHRSWYISDLPNQPTVSFACHHTFTAALPQYFHNTFTRHSQHCHHTFTNCAQHISHKFTHMHKPVSPLHVHMHCPLVLHTVIAPT